MHSLFILLLFVFVLTVIYHAKENWLDLLVVGVSIVLVLSVMTNKAAREGVRQIVTPVERILPGSR